MINRLELKIFTLSVLLLLAVLCLSPLPKAYAHGVGYRVSEKKAISLEFFYSTGEPLSYVEARVYSPADSEFAYQSGRTDEEGRFAFTPNAPGEWRVVAKDEEGHLAEAKVGVSGAFMESVGESGGEASPTLAGKAAMPRGWDLFAKALLGVSLIFNAATFASFATRRKAA